MDSKVVSERIFNHPYMEVMNSRLNKIKRFKECLELRLSLKRNFKDEWERNEHEILMMKTHDEINAKNQTIQEAEMYNIEFMNDFIPRLDACNAGLDSVIAKAKSESASEEVKKIVAVTNWDAIKTNLEARVKWYERVKPMV